MWPNTALEPTAVGAGSSAFAGGSSVPPWLSFWSLGDFAFMHPLSEAVGREFARSRRKEEFAKLNRRELASWPDEQLAAWQAEYPPESAQFILAQYEWSRRLTADQISATIKSARGQAWIGIAGVVIGALLGLLLR